ncbi:PDZ domain-containing protein [Desulfobotulus mexicanus]|uniref:PDZ domain-containing protein n=1 Tax=Desulfobotulus mexicanus TaxID=2586642 RepID=A0A5S5MDJ0_9BACT|nr:PDZ domain-containing protein [Desulfobotulus mexicanus]TYT73783.1 PDZ domain-containing protein [Desulfobotulus mexicanus]
MINRQMLSRLTFVFCLVFSLFLGVSGCSTQQVHVQKSDIAKSQPQPAPEVAPSQTKDEQQSVLYQEYITPDRLASAIDQFWHKFSGDGGTVVTSRLADDDNEKILWRYDQKLGAYVKSDIELERDIYSHTLSYDGSILAYNYREPKPSSSLVLLFTADGSKKMIELENVRTRELSMAFSRDGAYLAIGAFNRNRVKVFDVETLEKVGSLSTPRMDDVRLPGPYFSPDTKTVIVNEWRPSNDTSTNDISIGTIYSFPGLVRIRSYEEKGGLYGFSSEGDYLFFAPPRGTLSIIGTSSNKSLSVPEKLYAPVVAGPGNRLLKIWNNAFDEYLIHDEKVFHLQRKRFDERIPGLSAVYVETAKRWFGFGNKGEIVSMETASAELVQAAKAIAEGEGLIASGFKSSGIRKLKEGIAISPLYVRLYFNFYQNLKKEGLSHAELAELLLFHQRKLIDMDRTIIVFGIKGKDVPGGRMVEKLTNADGPAALAGLRAGDIIEAVDGIAITNGNELSLVLESKPVGSSFELTIRRQGQAHQVKISPAVSFADHLSLVRAARRFLEYGFLAFNSGYPDLTLAAAGKIRTLREEYPATLTDDGWENVMKGALALEAMVMAYQGEVDMAYEHLLEKGGLVHQGNTFAAYYILNYPDYWFPLFADPRRLAFLLDKKPEELTKPSTSRVAPQPYRDLTGRLVQPVSSPERLEQIPHTTPPPRQPVSEEQRPKGRVLD